jgi:hypothetical protein
MLEVAPFDDDVLEVEVESALAAFFAAAFFEVVEVEVDPQPVTRTAASIQAAHPSRATLQRISVFLLVRIREICSLPGSREHM